MIVNACDSGTGAQVSFEAPPLVVTKKEMSTALRKVKKVFKKLDG